MAEQQSNKIMMIGLAVIIIIAIAVLIYINLPTEPEPEPEPDSEDIIFTLQYDVQQKNFTLEELEQLTSYTGLGGYRTNAGSIRAFGNYTGFTMSTLVDTLDNVPSAYGLRIHSAEGDNQTYNFTTISGFIDIYNASNASDPDPIGTGNLTMILAYQFDGEYLNETTDGPLRIAFVNEEGAITRAKLWWSQVIKIEILTE